MKRIDINSDLGESFGCYTLGMDSEVLQYVSSANIACGFHAGDPLVMEHTVSHAVKLGTAIGAHPGFPDLMGFGRRNMACSPQEIKAYVQYQIGALQAFASSHGAKLQHVKPHGALYNLAGRDFNVAMAIAQAVSEIDPGLILLGLSGSQLIKAGRQAGLQTASEVFADRNYRSDGSLVPRVEPDSVIRDHEAAIVRTVQMVKEGAVKAVTGEVIPICADSICVHGDNPEAVSFARDIHRALQGEGIEVVPLIKLFL